MHTHSIHTHMNTYTCAHTYACMHTHVCIHTHVHTHINTHMQYTQACMHAHTRTYTSTFVCMCSQSPTHARTLECTHSCSQADSCTLIRQTVKHANRFLYILQRALWQNTQARAVWDCLPGKTSFGWPALLHQTNTHVCQGVKRSTLCPPNCPPHFQARGRKEWMVVRQWNLSLHA